ncbi:HEAT repeat domain-containing protein [bacterium]|nr:HEAT repeat domain-containing protein [bacterium]
MQFWALANDLCNTREAKRLFPLISSGGLIGSLLSGFIISYTLSLFSITHVILVWSAATIISIMLFSRIMKKYSFQLNIKTTSKIGIAAFSEGFQYFRKSTFMSLLGLLLFCMWLVLYICDYYYFGITCSKTPSPEKLASLYSLVRGGSSFFAIIVQIFITYRILKHFGVGSSLFIFPCIMFLAVLNTLIFPGTLWSAILLRSCRISMVYSIQDSVYHILFNSIPDQFRGRIRLFLDGLAVPIAIMSSGFILIFLNTFHIKNYMFLAIILLIGWILLASYLKKDYVRLLIKNLSESNYDMKFTAIESLSGIRDNNAIEPLINAMFNDTNPTVRANAVMALGKFKFSTQIFNSLKKALRDSNPFVRASAVQSLGNFNNDEVIELLVNILKTESVGRVKATTIKVISKLSHKGIIPIIEKNLNSNEESRIKANTIEAIIELKLTQFQDRIIELVKDKNNRVKGNAIMAIYTLGLEGKEIARKELDFMLRSGNKFMTASALFVISNIKIEGFEKEIIEIIKNSNNEVVVRNAIKCIINLNLINSIQLLVSMLQNNTPYNQIIITAIKSIISDDKLNWLEEKFHSSLNHENTEYVFLNNLIPLLTIFPDNIKTKLTRKILIESENSQILGKVINLIESANMIEFKSQIISMFTHKDAVIRAQIVKSLRIFEIPDVWKIFVNGLDDSDPRVRANILEEIFHLEEPIPSSYIQPLLNDSNDRVKATAAKILCKYSVDKGILTLKNMLRSNDKWTRINSLYAFGDLKNKDYAPLIIKATKDSDIDVQKNAYIALEKMNSDFINDINLSFDSDIKNISVVSDTLSNILLTDNINLLDEINSSEKIVISIKTVLKSILFKAEEFFIKEKALNSLHALSNVKYKNFFTQLLDSPDPRIRNITITCFYKAGINLTNKELCSYIKKELECLFKNKSMIHHLQMLIAKYDNTTVLIEELLNLDDIIFDNIFTFLSLNFDDSKLKIIKQRLKDTNKKMRANAIEALDSIVSKELSDILISDLERLYLEDISKKESEPKLNLPEISFLTGLLEMSDPALKSVTATILGEIVMSEIILPLVKLTKDHDSNVKKIAAETLEKIQDWSLMGNLIDDIQTNFIKKNETDEK